MTWPWIAGIAALVGLVLLAVSAARVARLVPALQHAQLKLQARRESVERLRGRVEKLQSDMTALQEKLPTKPE
ncbi:MAG TPA: hypothetical protein H9881_06700 [Candidatus Stackebrandtia excrementipullorum]|nr:hypothetical protein [Candidatus Stackebrandtia excrementipullorum]